MKWTCPRCDPKKEVPLQRVDELRSKDRYEFERAKGNRLGAIYKCQMCGRGYFYAEKGKVMETQLNCSILKKTVPVSFCRDCKVGCKHGS